MKIYNPLKNERGELLLLIFVTVTAVAGAAGYLAIRIAQEQGQEYSDTLDDIAANRSITDAQQDQAMRSFHNQFQVLSAGGNIINAIDVAPDGSSVVSAYRIGCNW